MGPVETGLNSLRSPEPLSAKHDTSLFDCNVPALNDWLRQRALKGDGRYSRTFVVCTGSGQVAGYHCVSASSLSRDAAPGALRRNAPEIIPMALIGRLAVCRSFARKGLGSDLLADAIARILQAAENIGIAAIAVHAKDDQAKSFYLSRAEFSEYPPASRTLFLPVQMALREMAP